MGMFDYVKCEVALPDGFEGELQTKDFDCPYLELYTITKAGRLIHRYVSGKEPAPESEWEYGGDDNPLHQLWHEQSKWKLIHAERDMNFHGVLHFYGSEGNVNTMHEPGSDYRWHEYNAKFTDGNLVSIEIAQERN